MTSGQTAAVDAVILAGGAAKRMGGADKPALPVGGTAMVSRVAEAVTNAQRVILVGPARPELPDAYLTRENPPGGGPVAAVAAGLQLVTADTVAVLAADLPFVEPDDIKALADRLEPNVDGALLVDDAGRDQLLAGVWWSASLRRALQAFPDPNGVSMRRLLAGMVFERVAISRQPAPWMDCDTLADIETARRLA